MKQFSLKAVDLNDIIGYTESAAVRSEVNGRRIKVPILVRELKDNPDPVDVWMFELSKEHMRTGDEKAKSLLCAFQNNDVVRAADFELLDNILTNSVHRGHNS